MHRSQKNSEFKSLSCVTQDTQHVHRKPNTRLRVFFGYYCGFLTLIPVGEVTIRFCDIDMVFY